MQPAPESVDHQDSHFAKAAAPGSGSGAAPGLNMVKKAAEDEGAPEQVPGIGDDDHRSGQGSALEQCSGFTCILKRRGGRLFVEDFCGRPAQGDRQCPCDGRFAVGLSGPRKNQVDIRVLTGQVQRGLYPTLQGRRGASIGPGGTTRHNDRRKRQNRCGAFPPPPVQPPGCCDPAGRDAQQKTQTGMFQMAW